MPAHEEAIPGLVEPSSVEASAFAPDSPQVTEEQPLGDIEQAKAKVITLRKSLEELLPIFGSETEEGKALNKALTTINSVDSFTSNSTASDLTNTEAQNAASALPQELLANLQVPQQNLSPELSGITPGGGQPIPPELLNLNLGGQV